MSENGNSSVGLTEFQLPSTRSLGQKSQLPQHFQMPRTKTTSIHITNKYRDDMRKELVVYDFQSYLCHQTCAERKPTLAVVIFRYEIFTP